MKTKERLLFMALGGLLVLAGMIVGQFVFSPVQAQAGAQDATFKTVRCEKLVVGDSLNPMAVVINGGGGGVGGFGMVSTFNKTGEIVTSLGTNDSGHGMIQTRSNKGKVLTSLSTTADTDNGTIATFNNAGRRIAGLSASIDGYGIIQTGSNTGKKLVDINSNEGGGLVSVFNLHGAHVATIQANKEKDGVIILKDRYGDFGWGRTGKQ